QRQGARRFRRSSAAAAQVDEGAAIQSDGGLGGTGKARNIGAGVVQRECAARVDREACDGAEDAVAAESERAAVDGNGAGGRVARGQGEGAGVVQGDAAGRHGGAGQGQRGVAADAAGEGGGVGGQHERRIRLGYGAVEGDRAAGKSNRSAIAVE